MIPEAVVSAEKAYLLVPWLPQVIGLLAGLLARTGDRSRADVLLPKLGDGQAYGTPLGFLLYYLASGEIDRAGHWAEKVIEQRHPLAVPILRQPYAKDLKSSPHWPTLMKLVNLPETSSP